MQKTVAILGSTGSIGKNALRVIEALGEEYKVAALTANSSIELLAEQAKQFKPEVIAVTEEKSYAPLKKLLGDSSIEILAGADSLVQVAEIEEVDIVITAVVGASGLPATLAAAGKVKQLAIANKEPLVIAGKLLMETALANDSTILPVDSEHSAIFQSMLSGTHREVNKIILTSSGGPFRGYSAQEIEKVSLEQALAHPTWDMGPKITIDSATMMNKALEVIEARWLFETPVEKIEVLIHPESTRILSCTETPPNFTSSNSNIFNW